MLVICSDLHLSDGTLNRSLSADAFSILVERLRDMAEAASWRADGSYHPIEQLDVVLLGDVFDVLRSKQWAEKPKVRPWGNPHDPAFVEMVDSITDRILKKNDRGLGMLRDLVRSGVSIPPACKSGRPAIGAEGEPVPIGIHYMVGECDWVYHLPGQNYDAIREKVRQAIGLAGRLPRPFAHEMTECDDLLQTMRKHKVAARHGDIFDPFSFEEDRNASGLSDVLVIELINRFPCEVEKALGEDLPEAVYQGLREIDGVRPLLLVPIWLDGLLERTCVYPSLRKQIKHIWNGLVEDFLDIDFVRDRDTWSSADLVEGLKRSLLFSKRISIGWAAAVTEWINKVRGATEDSYWRHAVTEPDFRNRRAKHIVYGHTHFAETIPLDASFAEGYVLNQMYFNAGTWRRIHKRTQLAPTDHEFIAHDTMNYITFFQADERKGRPYETWSGSLGFTPMENTIHRIDAGHAIQSRGHTLPTTPPAAVGHRTQPPHFVVTPGKSRNIPSAEAR